MAEKKASAALADWLSGGALACFLFSLLFFSLAFEPSVVGQCGGKKRYVCCWKTWLTFVFFRALLGDPEIEAKIMENPDALEKGSVDEVLEAVGHPRPSWLARKKAAKAKAGGKKK